MRALGRAGGNASERESACRCARLNARGIALQNLKGAAANRAQTDDADVDRFS